MRLTGAPVQRQDTVVHLEDTRLDHDDRVHVLLNVKLTNDISTTVHIILDILLISLHIQLLIGPRQNHLEVINRAGLLGTDVYDEARLDFLSYRNVQRLLHGLNSDARFPAREKRTVSTKRDGEAAICFGRIHKLSLRHLPNNY